MSTDDPPMTGDVLGRTHEEILGIGVLGETYVVTAQIPGEPGYSCRGVLASKRARYDGEIFWLIRGPLMIHLVPPSLIVEVEHEKRRYLW